VDQNQKTVVLQPSAEAKQGLLFLACCEALLTLIRMPVGTNVEQRLQALSEVGRMPLEEQIPALRDRSRFPVRSSQGLNVLAPHPLMHPPVNSEVSETQVEP
jgi:hypothetical protein